MGIKAEVMMKALMKYEKGKHNFACRELPVPEPGKDDVLVKVAYGGICGTDIHIYHDTYPNEPPMVIGHEFSGTVVKLGENAGRFKAGDRVVAETNQYYCGVCELCKAGRFCLCNQRLALGQKTDGVFAEYAVIKESNLHVIGDHVSMKEAALAEPLSCVVHGVMERSNIEAGDIVLVTGPGPIGLLAVMTAAMQGAKVIVSGTSADADRLKLAEELGAFRTVNVMQEDLQAIVAEETGGKGVDVVLECSGVGAAISSGIDALKKLGIFTQIGLTGKSSQIETDKLCFKEIDYKGCLSKTNWSWNRTIRIINSGSLPLGKLISHEFSLDQWEEAMKHAEENIGNKVFFRIGGDA